MVKPQECLSVFTHSPMSHQHGRKNDSWGAPTNANRVGGLWMAYRRMFSVQNALTKIVMPSHTCPQAGKCFLKQADKHEANYGGSISACDKELFTRFLYDRQAKLL